MNPFPESSVGWFGILLVLIGICILYYGRDK